ncbi:MAG TPA: hypothetical protein VHM26_14595 [Chitinophagaceae bacterium]|jgi:hypothetical protein|nr:hypothetical protein [Chitinophagaceae bacterium]
MKKLLTIFCCVLYLHGIGQSPMSRLSRNSGERSLVKALAAIVNRDGKKKMPVRKIVLPPQECPWV